MKTKSGFIPGLQWQHTRQLRGSSSLSPSDCDLCRIRWHKCIRWPHIQTRTLARGSENSFSFPAKISTSNHCTPDGMMTHAGLTNDSDFLLQPPKHSCHLLSSPQRGIRAEEKVMKQPLVHFSSLLWKNMTTLLPLPSAGGRREQTGTQVSPSWTWTAGTQTVRQSLRIVLSHFQKPMALSC